MVLPFTIGQRLTFVFVGLFLPMPVAVQENPDNQPAGKAVAVPAIGEASLIYVSDYFSFLGRDNQSRVALALDNNRGRDGETYQAEHFVVLYDEREGWMKIDGNGAYENVRHELMRIPDSVSFQFEGAPETGLTISSNPNRLTLRIDPLLVRTSHAHERSIVRMGSAPAVLTWRGRTIVGRVIYEYLIMPDFNRLTRTYRGLWKDFQGLYVLVEATGDIYLHRQQSERMAGLVGTMAGFVVLNDETDPMEQLQVEVLERTFAWGFYRWPTAWRITWTGSNGPASMTLTLSDRKTIAGWVIGGFAMGIVQGELSYGGRTIPLYGLAELLM
jgi:hypothetical protein